MVRERRVPVLRRSRRDFLPPSLRIHRSFAERVITTLADDPYAVVAIDVDGDGDVDALSASKDDDTVAWYENDCSTSPPTSTFAPSFAPSPAPSHAPSAAPTHALCTAGKYSADRAGESCRKCAPGTFANGTGAYACDICPVNTYAIGGAAECDACPAGRQSGLGSDSCGYCEQGQYQTLDANMSKMCVECDDGWYSSVGLTCDACGPGLYTPDRVNCVYCVSGTHRFGVFFYLFASRSPAVPQVQHGVRELGVRGLPRGHVQREWREQV